MTVAEDSLADRFDRWLTRTFVWRRGRGTPAPRLPVPDEPVAIRRRPPIVLVILVALAVILPVATASLLVPLREAIHTSTATLILVLPVVLVALIAGAGPGAVAAASSALAFDILLTRPYYSFTIEAATDVESALVLGVIALVVSSIVSRELAARSRSSSRRDELTAIEETARALADGDEDRLVEIVTATLRELLGLRSCDWSPGFHGTIHAVLQRDASIVGDRSSPGLPDGFLEVPVTYGGDELGRLVLRADSDAPVSVEERAVVLAIADLFAVGVAGRR